MFPILEAGPTLEGASLPAFVVARDGLYLRKRSLLGLSQTKVGRIAHLPEGTEFLDYALPKVPSDLMARAVGFYRDVLGLDLIRQDADSWAEFDAGGRRFALHTVGEGQALPRGGATAVFSGARSGTSRWHDDGRRNSRGHR